MTDRHRVRPAIDALSHGRFAVVVADGEEEAVGMLALAADHAAPARVNALTKLASGWSYLALSDERCEELGLRPVCPDAALAQTVTIRARGVRNAGVGGQAQTIAAAIDPAQPPEALQQGGHVIPLRSRPGGVLERAGHAEAAVDLARLAGGTPAALVGELLDEDGTTMQRLALQRFARRYRLPLLTIGDIVAHQRHAQLVEHVAETTLATLTGTYRVHGYRANVDGAEHAAFVRGDVTGIAAVPVYVHRSCWQGDIFGSRRCACRARLDAATRTIAAAGRGVIVHLARTSYYDDCGREDDRFELGARILTDLGLQRIRLLSDDAAADPAFEDDGLIVVAREPLTTVVRVAGGIGGR